MDPKQQLADLMDAFAAAKVSNNELLQRMVLQQVNAFFSSHQITPITPVTPPTEPQETGGTSWS